jgi:hypothetical protein
MSRVTPAEVKVIVATSLADPIVQVWIDAANTVVNNNVECINGTEAELTQIELYLSAHFVAMLDPSTRGYVTKDKIANAFETEYSDPAAIANTIDNTVYGTTANMLSNGCLANASDRAISLCALGGE